MNEKSSKIILIVKWLATASSEWIFLRQSAYDVLMIETEPNRIKKWSHAAERSLEWVASPKTWQEISIQPRLLVDNESNTKHNTEEVESMKRWKIIAIFVDSFTFIIATRHIIHCQQRFPMETIFLFDKRGPTMSMTCVDSCNILTNFKLFTMCKFEKEKILNINFTQTMRNFTVNSNIKRERRFQVFFWNWQSIQDFVTVQTKPSFVPASTNNSVSGERILRILIEM